MMCAKLMVAQLIGVSDKKKRFLIEVHKLFWSETQGDQDSWREAEDSSLQKASGLRSRSREHFYYFCQNKLNFLIPFFF